MQKEIIRITIKGASGYGSVDKAYEDRLSLASSSISYEYKPHPYSDSKTNIYRKWSYKTTSPLFKEIFEQVAAMTPDIINCDEDLFACDIGPTEIIVTYEDKRREIETFFCPSEYFKDYFRIIKKLIPGCEDIPVVLLTDEDFED